MKQLFWLEVGRIRISAFNLSFYDSWWNTQESAEGLEVALTIGTNAYMLLWKRTGDRSHATPPRQADDPHPATEGS